MAIVLRNTKGSALTYNELDNNFSELNTLKAPLASPTFTGVPAAPTAAVDTNTTQVATTAFVVGQGYLKSATAASTYLPLSGGTVTSNLTVNGSLNVTGGNLYVYGNGGNANEGVLRLDGDGDSYIYKTAGSVMRFVINSSEQAYMTGTHLYVTGNIGAYISDERLKTHIKVLEKPVDTLFKLRGVSFNWKEDGPQPARGSDVGLIAQEVQAVFPQAVCPAAFDHGEDGLSKSGEDYITIKLGYQVIALLVEAVKELATRVEALEAK